MQEVGKRNRRETVLAMAGLALVLFLVSLDGTVVGTAMPKIIAELNGFELYAWVTTAYLLAQTAVIPIIGKLGDLYGRKWFAVGGVALFVGASALCGMADSMIMLVAFRALQGIGGGMLFSTVFALIADIFPDPKERARYQGILFTVFSFSSLVGPVLGGWITDTLNWRWVFYVNLPPGLLALIALPLVLPQSEKRASVRIDYWGALTIVVAIVSLMLSLELISTNGFFSPLVLGILALGLVALAIFVAVELRAQEPIIPLTLFRNPTVTSTLLVSFMTGVVLLGVSLYTPLFGQAVLGLSASASGVMMMPMVVVLPLIAMVVGPMIAHFGSLKPFVLAGTGMMSLASLPLLTFNTDSNPIIIGAFLFLMALGLGTVLPTTPLVVQSAVERKDIGVATAAMQFLQSIGLTVGAALTGTLVTGGYRSELAARAPQGVPAEAVSSLQNPNALVDAGALDQLSKLMATMPNGTALTDALLDAARFALSSAIREGFFVVVGASVLALTFSFFIANLRLGANMPAEEEEGEESEHMAMPVHTM